MRYRALLFVLCAVLMVAAVDCGSTSAGSHSTPQTVTLTEKSNGATEALDVGTEVVVELAGVENFKWTTPATSDPSVVKLLNGASRADGGATATFTVVGRGQATLSALDNPKCFPICALPPAGGWRVTINAS